MKNRLSLCLLLFTVVASAQDTDMDPAILNMSKLNLKLTLDRSVYLPGERIEYTAQVRNLTPQSLLVPTPFESSSLGFQILRRNNEGIYVFASGSHDEAEPFKDLPAQSISPGQVIEWRSSEAYPAKQTPAPLRPGQYSLVWQYGGKPVPFQVVDGTIEVLSSALIGKLGSFNGAPTYHRWVGSIRVGGESVLCIEGTAATYPPDERDAAPGQLLSRADGFHGTLLRIATSAEPIRAIEATGAISGSLSILYTTQSGAQRRVDLSLPAMTDITGQVAAVRSGIRYDRAALTAVSSLRVTNNSGQSIKSPITAALIDLPPGVYLINSGGFLGSAPIQFSGADLLPGQSVVLPLKFKLPAIVPINYQVRVFSGQF